MAKILILIRAIQCDIIKQDVFQSLYYYRWIGLSLVTVTRATIDIARTIAATGPNSGTIVVPTIEMFSVRGPIGIDTIVSPVSFVVV